MSSSASRESENTLGGERHSLLRLLVEASGGMERRLHEGLRAAGYGDLRPAHYAVFRLLGPGGARVTELAEAGGMTKQSMGELVVYLEERGYVERRPDPGDRRAKIVVPTERGRRGIGVAAGLLEAIEAAVAERMGGERLEELAGSLEELTAVLDEPAPAWGDPAQGS